MIAGLDPVLFKGYQEQQPWLLFRQHHNHPRPRFFFLWIAPQKEYLPLQVSRANSVVEPGLFPCRQVAVNLFKISYMPSQQNLQEKRADG